MRIQIEGQPLSLGELRKLVTAVVGWPDSCEVIPKGSRTEPASITIETPTSESEQARIGAVVEAVSDAD